MAYVTLADIEALFRPLSAAEKEKAAALIPVVSASFQMEADKAGQDLDDMLEKKTFLAEVLKSVMVDVIQRNLLTPTDTAPMSTFSESANGYAVSGTFLVPGGGLFIKKSELARLGIRKARIRMVNLYDST